MTVRGLKRLRVVWKPEIIGCTLWRPKLMEALYEKREAENPLQTLHRQHLRSSYSQNLQAIHRCSPQSGERNELNG